jgi:tripartite-type tricarboxylate transporter receptor subunit TctC
MRIILAAAWITIIGIATGSAASAQAQNFPARPVSVIVTYPPGGPVDTVTRIVTEHLRGTFGQPFVIENVGGAGGSIGVGRLARATPNGYTIGVGDIGAFVLNGAVYALPYDLLTDFEPIALLATSPLLVLTRSTTPAKDLKELVAWLKDNQGKVSQGHIGSGTLSHLCGLYMQSIADATWTFVPYRGAAAALQDLTGGQIDLICAAPGGGALPLARGGQIKAYAVMAPARLASAPEIPTADEAGLSGFHVSFWQAMWAPKDTPKDVIAALNAAVVAALADPAVRGKFAELGQVIPPRAAQTPEALGVLRKAEADKWWPIIRAAGIKPE